MLEELNEGLVVEISPVVDLDLFVHGLKLLLNLVLSSCDEELVF